MRRRQVLELYGDRQPFRDVIGGDSHENTDLSENLPRLGVDDYRTTGRDTRIPTRTAVGLDNEARHRPDSAVRIRMALLSGHINTSSASAALTSCI